MESSKSDPVDHARTFRRHAGETVKNGPHALVYGAIFAAAALILGLCAFATGHLLAGCVAVVTAVVLGAASPAWLSHSHRKVRDAEVRWPQENSDELPPPSTS